MCAHCTKCRTCRPVLSNADSRRYTSPKDFRYFDSIRGTIDERRQKSRTSVPGGLDTSIILKWLREQYQREVVTFTADVGQGEEVEPARAKPKPWASKKFTDDLREEFARDFIYPMFRANTIYEGEYLLKTRSHAR